MAMSPIATAPVWRDQARRELAEREYESVLSEMAAAGIPFDPRFSSPGSATNQQQDWNNPGGSAPPVDRTTPPPPRGDPSAPRHDNPGGPGPGTGSGQAPGTGSGGRVFGTTPYTDRGSGSIRSGGIPYQGFDFTQSDQNRLIGKSAKYTLAEAVERAHAAGIEPMWKTKAGAQFFAENYIKPFFEENGFEVLQIVGDKMFVRDYEDRAAGRPGRWVDWVVNADGESMGLTPEIAWQAEAPSQMREERSPHDTSRFTRQEVDNLNRFSPREPAGAGTTTPDERAYELLARREERRERRMADLAGRGR